MEIITIAPEESEVNDFMSLESGTYKRFVFYQKMIHRIYNVANIAKKEDGTIYYSHSNMRIKRNNDGYYRHYSKKSGFTLDPEGKLRIWFGHRPQEIPLLKKVLTNLNKEWFPDQFMESLNKTLLEKVLNGKITNPEDYIKLYLKKHKIDVSHKLLLHAILNRNVTFYDLLKIKDIAKDFNHYLQYEIKKNNGLSDIYHSIKDLEHQALILNRRIDYDWSSKRMDEEHKKWTKEIMELEIGELSDEPIAWLQIYKELMPDGFTILDTQKAVFTEGKTMNHCIYTAYWNRIQNGSYMPIHVTKDGEKATLGLIVKDNEIELNQIHSRHNGTVSSDLNLYVIQWLRSFNKQLGFKQREFELVDF